MKRITWLVLCSIMWTGSVSFAQPFPESIRRSPDPTEPFNRTFTFAGRSFPGMQALSTPIDPEQYVVGPGDGLQIQVWGGVDLLHEVIVTAEGRIVVPTLGTLDVKGRTLKEMQALVAREAARYYRGASVAVSLALLRMFEVFVLGEVNQPGIYPATPVTRVTALLEQAGGVAPSGTLRRIELRRSTAGGNLTTVVDASRFLYDGVLEENPMVPDGATIFVPLNTGTAMIEGAVQRPGTYKLLHGRHRGRADRGGRRPETRRRRRPDGRAAGGAG